MTVQRPDVAGSAVPRVVVVGGANADVKARTSSPAVTGTSNPGHVRTTPGGVGRNIAEVLARLGTPCALVSVVADDPAGQMVLEATSAAGVDTTFVRTDASVTGTYVAVLDEHGELMIAVSDMPGADALTVEAVGAAAVLVDQATTVVLDGNLPLPALARAWDLAREAGATIVLDPVSVPKAARLAPLLRRGRRLDVLTPNRDELRSGLRQTPAELLGPAGEGAAGAVWERRGAAGSVLHLPDHAVTLPVVPAEVIDVTGAGDAMVGGMVHALVGGAAIIEACRFGHAVAAAVVASPHTVPPDLAATVRRRTNHQPTAQDLGT